MSDFNVYKWGVRIGGMVVFLLATTATVATLNCSLGPKVCDKDILDSLWKDSLVGALAVMAATAGQAVCMSSVEKSSPKTAKVNRGSRTSGTPESVDHSLSPGN